MAMPIKTMSAADLVRAVTEITRRPNKAIASSHDIYAWCSANDIDWGGALTPRGRHFWAADHANAPDVLRKFKLEPVSQRGPNGWCLASRWRDTCVWTARTEPRWRAVPWSRVDRNWIWKAAERVDGATPAFDVFDREALQRAPKG